MPARNMKAGFPMSRSVSPFHPHMGAGHRMPVTRTLTVTEQSRTQPIRRLKTDNKIRKVDRGQYSNSEQFEFHDLGRRVAVG